MKEVFNWAWVHSNGILVLAKAKSQPSNLKFTTMGGLESGKKWMEEEVLHKDRGARLPIDGVMLYITSFERLVRALEGYRTGLQWALESGKKYYIDDPKVDAILQLGAEIRAAVRHGLVVQHEVQEAVDFMLNWNLVFHKNIMRELMAVIDRCERRPK